MPQENVINFFKAVGSEKELKEKVAAQMKAHPPADEQNAMAKMVDIAAENGFQFSVDDLKSAAEQSDSTELTDEQLAAANGAGPLDFVHDLNWGGIVDWWLAQGR